MGRPWGPVSGTASEEMTALVRFLRERIDGSPLTLKALVGPLGLSSQRISELLAGKGQPTLAFVQKIVVLTTSPDHQPRVLLRAEALHRATYRASPAPMPATRPQQQVSESLLAQMQRLADLERTRGDSTVLIMVLLGMVGRLHQQVAHLGRAQEDLRARHPADAAELEQIRADLAHARQQQDRAQQALDEAQQQRSAAERLAVVTQQQIADLRAELDRLRAAQDRGGEPVEPLAPAAVPPATVAADDIDQALDKIDHVLTSGARTLHRLAEGEAGLHPPHGSPDIAATSDAPPDNAGQPLQAARELRAARATWGSEAVARAQSFIARVGELSRGSDAARRQWKEVRRELTTEEELGAVLAVLSAEGMEWELRSTARSIAQDARAPLLLDRLAEGGVTRAESVLQWESAHKHDGQPRPDPPQTFPPFPDVLRDAGGLRQVTRDEPLWLADIEQAARYWATRELDAEIRAPRDERIVQALCLAVGRHRAAAEVVPFVRALVTAQQFREADTVLQACSQRRAGEISRILGALLSDPDLGAQATWLQQEIVTTKSDDFQQALASRLARAHPAAAARFTAGARPDGP
ncbi:hypothetical protein ABZ721_34085 [Streptomyces sp. NPDC006733]|uniref:hypothetical protein n=1 Tax=Streptomyces sp. NPDC006733 TaxID=3155460 RepID=UPI0033E5C8C3